MSNLPSDDGVISEYDWTLILQRIHSGRCIPFIGAGASIGANLPSGADLAGILADECDYPGSERTDLFRIAQYYENVFDAFALRERVAELILKSTGRPGVVHQVVAALPFPLVLTTNFDRLIEVALREAGKPPRVGIHRRRERVRRLQPPAALEPLVYKLHGSVEEPDSLVVTEDDIIEFATALLLHDPDLPKVITRLFSDSTLLFIGYGLKDWNIRLVLRALRGRRVNTPAERKSFAIQLKPSQPAAAKEWERAVLYWQRNEGLRCFNIDAAVFATDLLRRHGERYPVGSP